MRRYQATGPFWLKFYWRARIIWMSFFWMFRFNLGDRVLYGGQEWILNNGVKPAVNPSEIVWDLIRRDPELRLSVRSSALVKVRSFRNYLGSWRSGYRFYMGYWYSIWVYGGIKPWMLSCEIWPKRKRVSV